MGETSVSWPLVFWLAAGACALFATSIMLRARALPDWVMVLTLWSGTLMFIGCATFNDTMRNIFAVMLTAGIVSCAIFWYQARRRN